MEVRRLPGETAAGDAEAGGETMLIASYAERTLARWRTKRRSAAGR